MNAYLTALTVDSGANLREALRQIDQNRKGFVVVISEDQKAVGVLTDGDIRRALLSGVVLDAMVSDCCMADFHSLSTSESINTAIDIFKNERIRFLPILDPDRHLVNVITRNQLHALLLQDISADLSYNFTEIDENIINYEIFQRPWGFYKTTVYNEYYQTKVINVYPGGQLSLQSHNHREEHWVVVHGTGLAQIGESVKNVSCGTYLFIPKNCIHRLTNTDDKESLIISEVQIGDYLGEDDVIRYEDKYGRV